MESPIDELIRRHDNFQFEIKLGYDLNRQRKNDRYKVEFYFFFPANLDVNETTYTKQQFYRDRLLYIRFKTPDFSLRALTDPGQSASPLNKISAKLESCSSGGLPETQRSLEYEIQLLGCVFKSALRDHALSIEKSLRRGPESPSDQCREDGSGLLGEYIRETRRILAMYRSYRDRFQPSILPERLINCYVFTDEYLSLLMEGRTYQLLKFIRERPSVPSVVKDAEPSLLSIIQEEIAYRRERGYPSLLQPDRDNEVFVFRMSVLKKYISSILHLPIERCEDSFGLRQMAMAIGAGIAMVFATSIAFYYQRIYGNLSLSFFIALVISYMFKDRIKALTQNYFLQKLSRHLFDHHIDIFDHFNGEKIGRCRESVQFVKESMVDTRILRLRNRDHITEIENGWQKEKILYYVKETTLNPGDVMRNQSRKSAVTDICRFNIRNFLRKMDDPRTTLFRLEGEGCQEVQGTRVYHINIVVKFAVSSRVRYERVRLVLSRDGIKRIEPVGGETPSAD
ncbi:MAG TPA: hypothetical protein PK876_06625 [Elusimicrobiota bacterium]|nr:hypothetical protein [Elusimicrobiota bacterium]